MGIEGPRPGGSEYRVNPVPKVEPASDRPRQEPNQPEQKPGDDLAKEQQGKQDPEFGWELDTFEPSEETPPDQPTEE